MSYICIVQDFDHIASFNPRECLSGKISRINRLTANIFRKYISPFGVTNSQLTLLFILSKNNGLSQKQLSAIAKLEKSTLNRNLTRLLEQKLLDNLNFPIINITKKGLKLVNSIIPEWEKAMSELRSIIGKDGELFVDTIHRKITSKE